MRYNKWIGMIAAGTFMLSACQREEVVPAPGYSTEVIAFTSPYMTRSTALRNDFNPNDQVGVVGYCWAMNGDVNNSDSEWDTKKVFAQPDMFYNEPLTYTEGGLWNYNHYTNTHVEGSGTGLCPWYENEDYTYSFFAYYPYAKFGDQSTSMVDDGVMRNYKYGEIADGKGKIYLTEEKTTGDPIIKYRLPHEGESASSDKLDWEKVPDFMLTYKIDHRKADGAVSLEFRHLLCALEFEVNNYNSFPVDVTQLTFSGENFYKEVIVKGQESGYSIGDTRYSGYFNLISGEGDALSIGKATVDSEGNLIPATEKLTADKAENLIDLLFITDALGKITDTKGRCGIKIAASSEAFTGGEITGGNMEISEMSFTAGVKSIFSINIVGNDFILQVRSDNNWIDGNVNEDGHGSNDDIRFE